jgi:hypothetical protein
MQNNSAHNTELIHFAGSLSNPLRGCWLCLRSWTKKARRIILKNSMLGTIHLTTFILSGLLLNLYPGQDTMYIISRSMSRGKKAGIISVLGISSGGLIHTSLAGLGLSSILAASHMAFDVVKIIGALYLLYLGLRIIFSNCRL